MITTDDTDLIIPPSGTRISQSLDVREHDNGRIYLTMFHEHGDDNEHARFAGLDITDLIAAMRARIEEQRAGDDALRRRLGVSA